MIKLVNNSDVDIVDYNVDKKLYTIKAHESLVVPDSAGIYLMKIYGFLVSEKTNEPESERKEPELETGIKDLEKEKKEEKTEDSDKDSDEEPEEELTGDLAELHGLGEKSLRKLFDSGIKTKEQFDKLSYEELKNIVGGLVASKFKS